MAFLIGSRIFEYSDGCTAAIVCGSSANKECTTFIDNGSGVRVYHLYNLGGCPYISSSTLTIDLKYKTDTIYYPWGSYTIGGYVGYVYFYYDLTDAIDFDFKATYKGITKYYSVRAPCTPNWQCNIPLDGYESDGCDNERYNELCEPLVVGCDKKELLMSITETYNDIYGGKIEFIKMNTFCNYSNPEAVIGVTTPWNEYKEVLLHPEDNTKEVIFNSEELQYRTYLLLFCGTETTKLQVETCYYDSSLCSIPISDFDIRPISHYLRPYEVEKIYPIWRALDGPSYIDPENEVVQWFNRNTKIINGILYYTATSNMVTQNYITDFEQFNTEDYWQNADYYLSNGLNGDCEDYAIGIASIFEAKGIPNMIVGGANTPNTKHWLLEYYINGEYYFTDTLFGYYGKRTDLFNTLWSPLIMFNKTTDYTNYNENWV